MFVKCMGCGRTHWSGSIEQRSCDKAFALLGGKAFAKKVLDKRAALIDKQTRIKNAHTDHGRTTGKKHTDSKGNTYFQALEYDVYVKPRKAAVPVVEEPEDPNKCTVSMDRPWNKPDVWPG